MFVTGRDRLYRRLGTVATMTAMAAAACAISPPQVPAPAGAQPQPAPGSATTGNTGGAHDVSVPVQHCATSSAGSAPQIPASMTATLPPELTNAVSFYSTGSITMLAPKGWHCQGKISQDGGADITVDSPSAGQAITAHIETANQGGISDLACPLFSEAAAADPSGGPCPTTSPPNERTHPLSATTITFEDPPSVRGIGNPSGGANPAEGVLVYKPSKLAMQATCTLPANQHTVCTQVLNDFLTRNDR